MDSSRPEYRLIAMQMPSTFYKIHGKEMNATTHLPEYYSSFSFHYLSMKLSRKS